MTTAVCPGSFDPVTFGHLDVIGRAAAVVDELVVAVGRNTGKRSLFSVAERVEMLVEVCAPFPNVTVEEFDGLLVDFCRVRGATVVFKGLRGAADADYEVQMAQLNRRLSGVDTVLLPTAPELSFVSSTRVRELAAFGGDLSDLVPAPVATRTVARAHAGGQRSTVPGEGSVVPMLDASRGRAETPPETRDGDAAPAPPGTEGRDG